MSFTADLEDDENPQDPNQASKTDSGVSLGGGGSGVASPGTSNPGSSSTGQAGEGTKPSSSGAWTNLQSYLDANPDQSSQMGSGVAGDVSGKAQRAQDETTSAASDFENQVNANTVQADPNAVSGAISKATGLKAGDTYGDDDASAFQKQANASYGGPTDFTKASGYQQAQKDAGDAESGLSELGSESGRDVLLQNRYQNASQNGYNQGEQNLDQMLLENNPQNQQAFSQTRDRWSGIGNLLGDTATAENGKAGQALATDQATAAAAQKALSDASSTFQGNLNSQLTQAQKAQTDAYNQMLADVKNGALTPADYQSLGLDPNQVIYNISDLTKYLTGPTGTPTLFNTATADQYAEAAALAKLAGQDSSTFLPGADASQAGEAAGFQPYGWDSSKLLTDIGLAKSGYEQGANTVRQAFLPFMNDPSNGPWGMPGKNASLEDIYNFFNSQNYWNQMSGVQAALNQYRQLQSTYTPTHTIGMPAGGLTTLHPGGVE